MVWPLERILDEEKLYLRVNKKNTYPSGYVVVPSVFSPKGDDGLSTDWEKYSTALECRDRAVSSNPEDNGVVSLISLKIREIDRLDAIHAPEQDNRAHSLIQGIPRKGVEKTRVRNILANIACLEIPIPLN